MEREIKFKAKNLVNGKWIEGDLLHGIRGNVMIRDTGFIAHDVDPSTVCQYTGLKDEDGVELFEGDYIQVLNETRFVEYNKRDGAFILCLDNGTAIRHLDFLSYFTFRVVGNRFDKEEGK